MSPSRTFGHNSNYDESGMPLGTTTADYDNAEEVRKNMVKTKYVEPIPLNDPDYQPKQFTKKETGMDRNHGLPHGEKGFNSAIVDPHVENMPVADEVDMGDPIESKKLLVEEAVAEGREEIPELPKTAKEEDINAVKEDIKEDKGEGFLKALEAEGEENK